MMTVTMDSVVPIKFGGKHVSNNKVPCCEDCNIFKGDLIPPKFQLEIFIDRIKEARRKYFGLKKSTTISGKKKKKIHFFSRKDFEKWKDVINDN